MQVIEQGFIGFRGTNGAGQGPEVFLIPRIIPGPFKLLVQVYHRTNYDQGW